jgi:hypothetical protein
MQTTKSMKPSASSFGFSKGIKDFSMTPKVSNYMSDGSGRDAYISFSNGGFRKKWENNFTSILTCKFLFL